MGQSENNKENMYKLRLTLETDIATPSVFHKFNPGWVKESKTRLKAIKDQYNDEKDYKAWKKTYLSEKYEKAAKEKYISCVYVFMGIGQYDIVLKEEVSSTPSNP